MFHHVPYHHRILQILKFILHVRLSPREGLIALAGMVITLNDTEPGCSMVFSDTSVQVKAVRGHDVNVHTEDAEIRQARPAICEGRSHRMEMGRGLKQGLTQGNRKG